MSYKVADISTRCSIQDALEDCRTAVAIRKELNYCRKPPHDDGLWEMWMYPTEDIQQLLRDHPEYLVGQWTDMHNQRYDVFALITSRWKGPHHLVFIKK